MGASVWSTCTHFDATAGVCGAMSIGVYLTGPRCADHTPARIAGRPETKPDPARTMKGLRAAADKAVAERVAAAEARAKGLRVFRPPSGPKGRYTSADVNLGKVHQAEREGADRLNARASA